MKREYGLGALLVLLCGCMQGGDAMAQRVLVPRRVVETGTNAGASPVEASEALARVRASHDLSYLDRLEQLRGHYDLMPFIEPLAAGTPGETGPAGVIFPAGSAANDVRLATRTRRYPMIAEELLEWGFTIEPGVQFGNMNSRVSVNLSQYQGQRPEHQPPFIKDDLLLGVLSGDLVRYRGGLFLPGGEDSETLAIQLRAAVPANFTGVFTPTFRGYRCYEKGSQRPIQFSYAEYAARNYRLAWFPQQVTLTLPASPSIAEAPPVDLTFPDDMVIDAILVEQSVERWSGTPNDPAPYVSNMLARIEPDSGAPLVSGWVSLPAIGYGTITTTTRWPLPYSVARDQVWRFRARKAYDDAQGAISITYVLLGSKLIPPKR